MSHVLEMLSISTFPCIFCTSRGNGYLNGSFVYISDWPYDAFLSSLNRFNLKKLTYEERKQKLIERLNALNSAAGDDEDDEDDE